MERVEELNARIASRFVASSPPDMTFSPRPASTKYMLFPMVDAVPPSQVPIASRPAVAFLPGNSAPRSGFSIDTESELRNIQYALQADDRAVYVPSSKSDLYVTHIPKAPVQQSHPLLFAHVVTNQPKLKVKEQLFNNVRLR
jgi:hypothetical protein